MKIAIIGLGYVGLPLLHAFSEKYNVIGFDISEQRVQELNNGRDRTLELSSSQLNDCTSNGALITTKINQLHECNFFIVTVPTPISKDKKPDLSSLIKASESVGSVLNKGDIVVYESTVYPGATEEDCVPVLEKFSKLQFNKDFYCGYSPERINPGDKEHTLSQIVKVTSGSTPEIARKIDNLYASIISAGTYLAPSIRVAEAAKVIENSQRDINIAFINELAIIFDKLDIDTNEVLAAANTKWNFLSFKPGLVGGHCIGIDPYYLTNKAQEVGHKPEVILAGRKINDSMGKYVANQVASLMIKKGFSLDKSTVLVLGITFKENCPDIRNTKVIDVIEELKKSGCSVDVADYWADFDEVKNTFNIDLCQEVIFQNYNAVILAVAHDEYKSLELKNDKQVVYDIKSVLQSYDGRL
jgi:UDP-N-acetyl-D-galactosamine dehydrogenase